MTGTAALLAGLGVVAIGFGLLSALIALIQPYTDPIWIFGNLVVGLVLLGAAIFMSLDTLRERFRSSGGRRAGKYGSSAILSAVLGVVILGFLGFLSTRYNHRFDLSESKVHTLSQQTADLLAGLDETITATAFFGEEESPPIRDLLSRYAYASDRFELEFVDPNSAPGLVDELGLTTEELARGLVRFSLPSGEATSLSAFSEPDITGALFKLVKSADKVVYFLEGHNERVVTGASEEEGRFAAGPDTYGQAASALVNERYRVESLLLASVGDVPVDASALIVAGPTRLLLAGELAAIDRYVRGGGSVFVALDPRSRTNVYEVLEGWGIFLGDDVVVDQALALFDQATTPIAGAYDGRHPITSLMREPTLFPMVRSIEIAETFVDDYRLIVKTGNESWAERDLEAWRRTGRAEYGDEDLLGPVTVAVAGEPRLAGMGSGGEEDATPQGAATAGRIVVFGDSDFATNEYLGALRNRDLFLNAINWLAGDTEQITVRPNLSRASSFQMSQDEFRIIQYLSLFVLPEAIAVVGVIVWWLRRKAPGRSGATDR
ncbi:MAG: GldG family protein [Myxococcota bacterium]